MRAHRPQPHPRLTGWVALAIGVVATLACGPVPEQPSNGPEQDLVLDPNCTDDTPLEFTLFQELPSGEIVAFGPADSPALHFGAQGGQHVMIGVALANPVEEYPGVETTITVTSCPEPCESPQVIGRATVVNYPGDSRWDGRSDGSVDLGPYVVTLDFYGDGAAAPATIDVSLRDVCSRTGSLEWRGVL